MSANTLFANLVIDWYVKGGPVMIPILIAQVVAFAVIVERVFWYIRDKSKRDNDKLEKIFAAVEQNEIKTASSLARTSEDPRIRVIWHGLNHHHSSMQGALQVASGIEIERAGRFLPVMDTIVTLAPLLGLLGTVTGIMHAFSAVGDSGLEASKVTGGIGEALIATATGLAIAIACLIFFNFFQRKCEKLRFELETACTNLEVMISSKKNEGSAV
jgi:biopolymer transport protein ExbB